MVVLNNQPGPSTNRPEQTIPTVFISYSRKDEAEKDSLLTHLGILHHTGLIDLWSDDRISAGANWKEEISHAMERASVAILFVTANFLNSEFILREEIPKLLTRQQEEGLIIMPIIAKACLWQTVDWLAKMNVRPRNGTPIWGEGHEVEILLAAIAQEVADIVQRSSSPALKVNPPVELPTIENPKQLALPAGAETILKMMFGDCQRVVIIKEFGNGFSGSRIFMVRPIMNDATAHLRTVVKLATVSMIQKEWQAYQTCIRNRLPDAAQIQGEPILPSDSEWGGLRYSLQGGGGTFEIESLATYLHNADFEDIHFVLRRLFKRLEQILQQSSSGFEFHFQTSYDRILPINYLIEPTAASGKVPKLLNPETVFDQRLRQDDLVQVEGFVITKVDPKHKSVTLNLPSSSSPASYQLRLKPNETIGADQLGQVMDPIEGVVVETRQDKFKAETRRLLGPKFDPASETVSWSGGPVLPNPLAAWPRILNEVRDIKIACIHGDLNMENILVDPDTRDVSLIDFAESRQDYVLHDFLRLETEIITKIIPKILHHHNLPPETIYTFYQQLYAAISYPNETAAPPNRGLEKPWEILLFIREIAKQYLWKHNDWSEYYQGLALYLLGALKFKNLDEMDDTPAPLPKQVAFWAAATVVGLMKRESPPLPSPLLQEQQRIDAVVSNQAEVGQQMNLFVQGRFSDAPLLGIQDWLVKQKPSSTEQVAKSGAFISNQDQSVDFVIFTALEEERDAVLSKLPEYQKFPPNEDDVRVYFGANLPVRLADGSTGLYRIVITTPLDMGRVQAATATSDAIRRWHPRYVILVGIAGGIADEGVELGDILVSDQIVDYELQKLTGRTPKVRWKVHPADATLLAAVRNFTTQTCFEFITVERPAVGKPRRYLGPIASGDKVIAFGKVLAKYRKSWPKLLGVEMEAGGAIAATFQAVSRPGFLMVRGVSDLADEQKNTADVEKWRSYACDVAAAYVITWLQSGPVVLSSNQKLSLPIQPISVSMPQLKLEGPHGTMPPESAFYIERDTDNKCRGHLSSTDSITIAIEAPRQMGKSSLIRRVTHWVTHQHYQKVAFVDFQKLPRQLLEDKKSFLIEFCCMIGDELGIPEAIDKYWRGRRTDFYKCGLYLSDYIIPRVDEDFILAIDEIEKVLLSPFRSDFFGMLRTWHNDKGNNESFAKMTMLLSSSTESDTFIDAHQSPFNVAEHIYLQDFSRTQVAELNNRHNFPLTSNQVDDLMNLVEGQPFLTRLSFYLLASKSINIATMLAQATEDTGPFASHLRYYLGKVLGEPVLKETLTEICLDGTFQDAQAYYRLKGLGLVKRRGREVVLRNNLYMRYFEDRLI